MYACSAVLLKVSEIIIIIKKLRVFVKGQLQGGGGY